LGFFHHLGGKEGLILFFLWGTGFKEGSIHDCGSSRLCKSHGFQLSSGLWHVFFFWFFVVETLASSSAAVAVTSPSPTASLMFV
jgi:hypothetical protein